jgi:hypothetical protein
MIELIPSTLNYEWFCSEMIFKTPSKASKARQVKASAVVELRRKDYRNFWLKNISFPIDDKLLLTLQGIQRLGVGKPLAVPDEGFSFSKEGYAKMSLECYSTLIRIKALLQLEIGSFTEFVDHIRHGTDIYPQILCVLYQACSSFYLDEIILRTSQLDATAAKQAVLSIEQMVIYEALTFAFYLIEEVPVNPNNIEFHCGTICSLFNPEVKFQDSPGGRLLLMKLLLDIFLHSKLARRLFQLESDFRIRLLRENDALQSSYSLIKLRNPEDAQLPVYQSALYLMNATIQGTSNSLDPIGEDRFLNSYYIISDCVYQLAEGSVTVFIGDSGRKRLLASLDKRGYREVALARLLESSCLQNSINEILNECVAFAQSYPTVFTASLLASISLYQDNLIDIKRITGPSQSDQNSVTFHEHQSFTEWLEPRMHLFNPLLTSFVSRVFDKDHNISELKSASCGACGKPVVQSTITQYFHEKTSCVYGLAAHTQVDVAERAVVDFPVEMKSESNEFYCDKCGNTQNDRSSLKIHRRKCKVTQKEDRVAQDVDVQIESHDIKSFFETECSLPKFSTQNLPLFDLDPSRTKKPQSLEVYTILAAVHSQAVDM